MMAKEGAQPRADRFCTVEEYFSLEAASNTRHEYVAGEVAAMDGASPQHNRITANLARELGNALRASKECEPFVTDMRVKTKRAIAILMS